LWRIGLSRGGKLAKIDALLRNRSLGNEGMHCRGARLVVELGTDEHARYVELRPQELVYGPNSLGHEEVLPLASFPPT
jgi:hypothetical protein